MLPRMKGKPTRRSDLPDFVKKALNPYVAEAERFAKEFRAELKQKFQADIGTTIDDLRALDHVCRFNRAAFDDGMVLRAGFFFGEVLRHHYRARYLWDTRKNALSLRIGEVCAFPIEKMRKVIVEKDAGTLEEYLMVLAKVVADARGHGKGQGVKPGAAAAGGEADGGEDGAEAGAGSASE